MVNIFNQDVWDVASLQTRLFFHDNFRATLPRAPRLASASELTICNDDETHVINSFFYREHRGLTGVVVAIK